MTWPADFVPKTMKQKLLHYLSDRQWHNSLEIALACGKGGPAWSFDQRKNELVRDKGFRFEREIINGVFWWRLMDDPVDIDFEKCCLIPEARLKVKVQKGEQVSLVV